MLSDNVTFGKIRKILRHNGVDDLWYSFPDDPRKAGTDLCLVVEKWHSGYRVLQYERGVVEDEWQCSTENKAALKVLYRMLRTHANTYGWSQYASSDP